jgi:sugar lactone lactonase YvrE
MKGFAAVLSLCVLVLTGCGMGAVSGTASSGGGASAGSLVVQGTVHGGQQPVANSKVSLWTVGTTGYGLSPTQLTTTFTGNNGSFSLPAPTCAQAGELTYLTAVGGSPGGTANPANAQISLMAAIGPCSGAAGTNVNLNEVTTVATVFALAKFMAYDLTTNSAPGIDVGYLAPSTVGITNAFATVNNLVNISTGTAYQYTPNGNGLVPQAEINTLANLLALCVNSSGGTNTGTACGNLFAQVPSPSYPANTLQTMLNIALQPGNNPSGQWSLVTTGGPFQPTLTAQPNDWALPVLYSGAGPAVEDLAIDASGNIWTANAGQNGNNGGVSELSNLGVPFAGSPYLGGNSGMDGIAVDLGGNAWAVNGNTAQIYEVTPGGASTYGPFSFQETSSPRGIAVDPSNNIWVVNSSSNTVTKLSNSGPASSAISPSGGYTGSGLSSPYDVAIDESGDAWVTNYATGGLTEITPAGSLSSYGAAQAATQGIAVDQSGNLWVDNTGTTVQQITSNGSTGSHTPSNNAAKSGGSYLAIDGADNLWVANQTGNSLSGFNVSGGVSTLSPSTGYTGPAFTIASPSYSGVSLNTPYVARVDPSGNVWVGNYNSIPIGTQTISYLTEFIGLAVPTVEPLAAAAQQQLIGLRPGSSPGSTLAVTSSSLPSGVQTAKYSYQLLANGGTGNGYTWTLTAGQSALNSVGLTLSSSGLLSGTLSGTVSGASIGFKVTDSAGNTATATLSLTVNALTTLSITTTNISAGTVGTNYNQAFAATGGSGSYTWTIPSSSQQTALNNIGINFSNSGYLAGTPTAATTGISFTVKVTDLATGQTASAPYTFLANNPVLQQCTHDGSGNALLNGHYAFLLTGFDSAGNVLDQIGSFQANGRAHHERLGDSNNSN